MPRISSYNTLYYVLPTWRVGKNRRFRSKRARTLILEAVRFSGYGHDGLGVCLNDCQTEAYLKGMTELASAWAMARRRPEEYRRKVDAATRCSGVRSRT